MKVFTADQIGTILGVSRERVWEIVKRGLIAPIYTRGQKQYDIAGLARAAVFFSAQAALGQTSGLPALIVRNASEQIDQIAEEILNGSALDVQIGQMPGVSSGVRLEIPMSVNVDELQRVPA